VGNPEHVERLKKGGWNAWRRDNPTIRPDLSFADLSRADLSRADLSGANLSRADLSGADLSDANLGNAGLSGATLSNAKNLTQTQLDEACGNATKLPEGLTIKMCSTD
jgi:uncharacterized protein YjbI with pentapeptide repeats